MKSDFVFSFIEFLNILILLLVVWQCLTNSANQNAKAEIQEQLRIPSKNNEHANKISSCIINLKEHLKTYLMKFLKWLWKYLFIIIIVTVVTIFIGYLVIRWIRYNDTYLYRYLFQDSNGKFAWTGFTAIIAIITLAINAWDNRRKFRADLISKSRLGWIDDVRTRTASFIEACNEEDDKKVNEYGSLLRLHFSYDQKNQENVFSKAESEDEIVINEKLLKKLMNKKTNNGKNVLINEYINEIGLLVREEKLSQLKKRYPNKNIFRISFDGSIKEYEKDDIWGIFLSNFIEIIRLYLKIEWERAKKGE